MGMRRLIILAILMFGSLICTGQSDELLQYKWKNRVFVIFSQNHADDSVQAQYSKLIADKKGMEVRKLVVISATPSTMRQLYPKKTKSTSSELWEDVKLSDLPYEAVLIGLDGKEKDRFISPVSASILFDKIDTMPMRKAEMRGY